jgi:hypothetical protein
MQAGAEACRGRGRRTRLASFELATSFMPPPSIDLKGGEVVRW